ncbi:IS66 family transposase [Alicyclobacillus sendaiensis]|uniref:Transposase n=1 Tax=Alicyclobacillus sendaiensis PA2 TaxID=3029425 RepID=A0ABT6XZL2_ALISE|nr:transposase [Alicyclobacillus sendaiensis]MDI9260528.1 transposase [Alicyclobacillus sendaiensis PA2]
MHDYLKQWTKLIPYVEDGHLEIDNNRCDCSLKTFVMGWKNWLFGSSPRLCVNCSLRRMER